MSALFNQRIRFDGCADEDWLCCPACGFFGGLHHDTVTIFERSQEDAPSQALEIDNIWKMRRGEGDNNPSSRRDGVAIRFWCESCPTISELTIAQHKGTTILQWRRAGTRVETCP